MVPMLISSSEGIDEVDGLEEWGWGGGGSVGESGVGDKGDCGGGGQGAFKIVFCQLDYIRFSLYI